MKLFFITLLIILFFSNHLLAAFCPAGDAGKMRYSGGVMEYCTGTHWIDTTVSTAAVCVAGNTGKVRYSSSEYQYCNGANWMSMKGSTITTCTGADAGKQRFNSSKMQFCDGSNWYEMGITDPYWNNVVLLIQPTAVSSSATDLSLSNHTVTSNGGVALNNSVSDAWGGSRKVIDCDGSDDTLSVADSNDWSYGSGDVTIETWIRTPSSMSSFYYGPLIFHGDDANNYHQVALNNFYNGGEELNQQVGGTTIFQVDSGADRTSPTNTWAHIAYTRSGNTHRIFFNGSLSGTTTNASALLNYSTALYICGTGSTYFFDGQVSAVRITKGIARYTSGFTPSTKAFPAQ